MLILFRQIFVAQAVAFALLVATTEVHLPEWYLRRLSPLAPATCVLPARSQEALRMAQFGEDTLLIDSFFKYQRCGFYIELGGHDGKSISTTWYFNKQFAWRGLLIEGNPRLFQEMKINRPDDITVHAAICNDMRTVHFLEAEGIGGIWEFMTEKHKRTWNLTEHGAKPVACVPLKTLLSSFYIRVVDLLSLDVEGAELSVLQTIDFRHVTIKVIILEYKEGEERAAMIHSFLARFGYTFYNHVKQNAIFYRADLITPLS